MNLPNKITVFRMFVAPVFLIFYLLNIPHNFLIAAIIFIIGSVTDAIDGNLARKRNLVTNFGKLLDPIADKMLVTACMLCFMKDGLCNIWLVMIMLSREFAVTSFRLVASSQGVVIPANVFGKIKTVMQMSFSSLILFVFDIVSNTGFDFPISIVSNVLMLLTTIMSVVSGLIYIIKGAKLIDMTK